MDNHSLKTSQGRMKFDQDVCGSELLKLVARGSAIIAEIFRLKDHIPEIYTNPSEEKKYQGIIFDFTYFKNVDSYEDKIKDNPELRNLDEEFRENYLEILERYYLVFLSIYQYISDWELYISHVNKGVFVQHTIETILMSKEIRHLLCESIYLYGVMLLIIDRLILGNIREKMIVSYYRYKGQSTIQNFENLVNLFKSTDYVYTNNITEKKPKRYPVDYFARIKIDHDIIKMIVGIVKDSDIYDQIAAYPSPEHRSQALSSQASIVFTLLFFIPEYLDVENSKMREIVDKHFSDNWVLSIYMGYTADILEYWKEFKAAKNALEITINQDTVKEIKKNFMNKMTDSYQRLRKFMTEGMMNEDYVLDNINPLLTLMRESNVILKWILLHKITSLKKYKELINQDLKNNDLINFLLSMSHFEYILKNMFQKLINNKEKMWNEDKQECLFRLKELEEYFAGNKTFGKQYKSEEFKEFFKKHYKSLEELTYANSTSAGRKIIIMKDSLDDIRKYHYIESNLQIKQYLNEISQYLNHMLRIVNIKKQVLVNIAQISDFSYAWVVIQDYSSIMQEFLKQDSKSVLLLRAAFLKLASIMNFPLVRIIEADSKDFASVSGYYSGELVKFVRNVLQIVPVSVFNILDNIIKIFSKGFKEMPIKILKADLKDYSQLDERYLLSQSTHQISLYTKAILMMEKTFMGVIEVDPKNILEDGIRKELLNLLANTFHKFFDFSGVGSNPTSSLPLQTKLQELSKIIVSIKNAFVYIQDYINIDGSRIWYEEMHRLINYYVCIEANTFLSRKIKLDTRYDFQKYQIPRFPVNPKEPESATFLGKLIRHILAITKSKHSIYYPSTLSWYDLNSKEILGIKTINMIKQCIGVEGIQGLYKLISYMNVNQISNIKKAYNKCTNDKNYLKYIKPVTTVMKNPCILEYCETDVNKNILTAISSLTNTFSSFFLPTILLIGQNEIVRHLIVHCLKESVEVETSILDSQITNLNNLNLYLLKNNKELKFKDIPNDGRDISNQNQLIKITDKEYYRELCNLFEYFGMVKSIDTFYMDISKLSNLSLILSIIAFNEMINTFIYDKKTGCVYKKNKNDDFEFFYFLYGIYIVLKQMGQNHLILFLSFSTFLIKNNLTNQFTMKKKETMEKSPEIPNNLIMLQLFIQEFCNTFNIEDKLIEIVLHPYLNFKSVLTD